MADRADPNAAYKAEINTCKRKVEQNQLVISQVKGDILAIQAQIQHMSSSLEDPNTEISAQDIQTQIDYWKGKYESVHKLYQELRAEHMKLLAEFEELKALSGTDDDMKELQGQIQEQTKRITKMTKDNSTLKKQLDNLKTEQEDEINRLKRRMMDLTIKSRDSKSAEEVELLETEMLSEKSKIAELEDQIRQRKHSVTPERKKKIEDLAVNAKAAEEARNREMDSLKSEIGLLMLSREEEREKLETELASLRKAIDEDRVDLELEIRKVLGIIAATLLKFKGNDNAVKIMMGDVISQTERLVRETDSDRLLLIQNSDLEAFHFYQQNRKFAKGVSKAIQSIGKMTADALGLKADDPKAIYVWGNEVYLASVQLIASVRLLPSTNSSLEEIGYRLRSLIQQLFQRVFEESGISCESVLGSDALILSTDPYDVDPSFKKDEMSQQVKIMDLEHSLDLEKMRLNQTRQRRTRLEV